MEIIFSDKFRKDYKKIKDKKVRLRILKQVKKIGEYSDVGKPLGSRLTGYRSLRIKPFRIIYKIEGNKIIINCFNHRKRVYDD